MYGGGVQLLGESSSEIGRQVDIFKQEVVGKYAGDWQRFFIDWYRSTLAHQESSKALHKQTQTELKAGFAEVISTLKREKSTLEFSLVESSKSLKKLQCRVESLEQTLSYLRERESSREQEQLVISARRARRRARTRLPLRDPVYAKEYEVAQSKITGASFASSRDRVCLLLLYLTGIRVRSLRHTTAAHLKVLLNFLEEDSGTLSFPGIKSSSARAIHIPLTNHARKYILSVKSDIERLMSCRSPSELVFSRVEGSSDLLSVTNLTKRINRILEWCSQALGRLLRSHSFRIGLTTAISASSGTDMARELVGHSDIRTTASYSRHHFQQPEIRRAIENSLKEREKAFRRTKPGRKSSPSPTETPSKIEQPVSPETNYNCNGPKGASPSMVV